MVDEENPELRDEQRTQVSQAQRSQISNKSRSVFTRSIRSKASGASSRTYVSKLEKELNHEKEARLRLQKEIEEIKKVNSEISSKLGLKTKH